MRAAQTRAKLILVLICVIPSKYNSFFFSDILLARCFFAQVAVNPLPHTGKNEMNIVFFSTSSTLETIQQLMKILLCFGQFRASFGELVTDNQVKKITPEIESLYAIRFNVWSLVFISARSSVYKGLALKQLKGRLSLDIIADVMHALRKSISVLVGSHMCIPTLRTEESM